MSDWILYVVKDVGISASEIKGSISALRNMHLVFGKEDYAKSGNRHIGIPKDLELNVAPQSKTPFHFG